MLHELLATGSVRGANLVPEPDVMVCMRYGCGAEVMEHPRRANMGRMSTSPHRYNINLLVFLH